jgi:hypothetical protein
VVTDWYNAPTKPTNVMSHPRVRNCVINPPNIRGASVAATYDIRPLAVFIAGKFQVTRWVWQVWHSVQTKFREHGTGLQTA